MAYIAPIHRPSSVRHALYMRLVPEEESLVVAKANRIEVWRLSEDDDHLTLAHSQMVFGTISMLQALRPKDAATELLFVGTDRFEYFTLAWDAATQRLQTVENFQDVDEKHLRDSQSQDRCIVDPSGRYMALLLWEGVLSVLRLQVRRDKVRSLQWMDQVRLSELFIKACTFLHSDTGHPRVAFLYQSQSDHAEAKLSSYRLTSDDHNAVVSKFDPHKDREINLDLDDPGAALLIPVDKVEDEKRHNVRNVAAARAHLGGLLVVGETRLLYIDSVTHRTVEAPLKAASIFVAWARYDATHYFLADDYGVLHLLTILTSGPVVTGLVVSRIGTTSRASCLVFVESRRLLFVGSHNGDSQLFRVDLAAEPSPTCTLVQVLFNIAPILDFAIMDMGNREDDQQLANEYASGQARLVTASGVHKDGSLRSVRSGVGLEDVGILGELSDARALFSLRSPRAPPGGQVDTLVASFLTETRAFVFDGDGSIEEVESYPGLALGDQTLWTANLGAGGTSQRLLQIAPRSVTLADMDSGMVVATWTPPDGKTITSASANDRYALLSIEGTQLVSLHLQQENLVVAAEKEIGKADQVACVHAAPQLLDVGVVGLWSSGTLSIVDLGTLAQQHSGVSLRRREDNASTPRSIALAQVLPPHVGGPTLFAAMDDGNVVTFSVSAADLTLSARKSIVLGTRHARLHLLPQTNGTYNIFATTEHPSLIYGSEGRIIYAAVTAEDANFVCPFDAAAFPGALAVATDRELKIARTDTQKQTHVRTIEVGETVRRIAYSPAEKVFALGCIRRELTPGAEVITSSVRLVDEVIFQPLGHPLALDAENTEVVECVIRAELTDSLGQPAERFVVGTSFMGDAAPDEDDALTQGRLLVIGVDSDRNPYLVSAHRMRGPVRALAMLDGLIVVGLSKTVILGRYTETTSLSGQLKKVASYRTATYVIDLAVHDRTIAVGDMMKSTALIEYVPAAAAAAADDKKADRKDDKDDKDDNGKDSKASLVERARYFQASWVTAVSHIDGDSWLEADGFGNLSVLERNVSGVTAEDRRRLRSTSEIHLGEMVNRIRPLVVEASPGALIHPRAFLATVEGSIYMFGTVAPAAQDLLLRLQTKLAGLVQTPGGTSFLSYRGFRNTEREADEPFRFLDGELLERFLELDEDLQQSVVEGLGPSAEELCNTIEELKRLH